MASVAAPLMRVVRVYLYASPPKWQLMMAPLFENLLYGVVSDDCLQEAIAQRCVAAKASLHFTSIRTVKVG